MTDSPDENALVRGRGRGRGRMCACEHGCALRFAFQVAAAHALGYQILSKTPTECTVKMPTRDTKQVRAYSRGRQA